MKSVLTLCLLGLALCAGRPTGAQTSGALPRAPDSAAGVSALGRLEPEHGVLRIAAPSTPQAISGSIVRELFVEVGDQVAAGTLLATTDSTATLQATVRETAAELRLRTSAAEAAASQAEEACVLADLAAREATRRVRLAEEKVISVEESDRADSDAQAAAAACSSARAGKRLADSAIELARTGKARAESELERSRIKAPVAGRVLQIHARPGELVTGDGLLDLGQVERMYAIAEVYETDIRHVRVGQRATVSSDALAQPLAGRVERIRPRVKKQDVVGTDPAARKDARIVEVEILLDDPKPAANLTHLQVEVVIATGS